MGKYRILITVVLIVTSAAIYVSAQNREGGSELRPSRTAFLEGYLLKLGEQYDVYFTLETAWQGKEFVNWMEQYEVRQLSKGDGIQRELEMLTERVPYFTYAFNAANSRVIHIKDARLAQHPAYGMDDVINLNYKGSWMGLVNALGERGIKVSSTGPMWIGDPRARDYSTQIKLGGAEHNRT